MLVKSVTLFYNAQISETVLINKNFNELSIFNNFCICVNICILVFNNFCICKYVCIECKRACK